MKWLKKLRPQKPEPEGTFELTETGRAMATVVFVAREVLHYEWPEVVETVNREGPIFFKSIGFPWPGDLEESEVQALFEISAEHIKDAVAEQFFQPLL